MTKGTIVYLGGFELPDRNAAALRVTANAKLLRDLGFDVILVGVDSSRQGGGLCRTCEDYLGFECYTIPYPRTNRSWLRYITSPETLIRVLDGRPELNLVGVVCYNYPAVAQFRIHLLCRRRGVRHFADATEWYDGDTGHPVKNLVKRFDVALRMYFIHARADGVLTTSKFLTDFYAARRKATVELPTLFDTNRFAPPRMEPACPRRFIYVGIPFEAGRVNQQRTNLKERLDTAVKVFHRLFRLGYQFVFDIYGIDQSAYLRVFPEHKPVLDEMRDQVCFHGRLPNRTVLQQVSNSDYSIFFRDETRVTLAGFPSKAAESISCGVPVISNRMVSLEHYRQVPGMFLAEKGGEFDLVRQLCELPASELAAVRQAAYESRAFDYGRYRARVGLFLEEVGLR